MVFRKSVIRTRRTQEYQYEPIIKFLLPDKISKSFRPDRWWQRTLDISSHELYSRAARSESNKHEVLCRVGLPKKGQRRGWA